MVVGQREIWWAALPDPLGSGPGFRRPVLVVQANAFNRSALSTVICVPLTSNLRLAAAPGNVRLPSRDTGLAKASVANVSALVAIDKRFLEQRVGRVPATLWHRIRDGLDLILDEG